MARATARAKRRGFLCSSGGAGSVLETQNGEWLHAGFKVQALGGGGQVGRTAYASPKSGAKMSRGCAEIAEMLGAASGHLCAVGLQFVMPVLGYGCRGHYREVQWPHVHIYIPTCDSRAPSEETCQDSGLRSPHYKVPGM